MQLRNDAVEWRAVEGEVVALDLRDQVYLGVNGSGAVLWPLLVAGTDEEAMVAALVETYDGLDEEAATTDVRAFVEMLSERDLV